MHVSYLLGEKAAGNYALFLCSLDKPPAPLQFLRGDKWGGLNQDATRPRREDTRHMHPSWSSSLRRREHFGVFFLNKALTRLSSWKCLLRRRDYTVWSHAYLYCEFSWNEPCEAVRYKWPPWDEETEVVSSSQEEEELVCGGTRTRLSPRIIAAIKLCVFTSWQIRGSDMLKSLWCLCPERALLKLQTFPRGDYLRDSPHFGCTLGEIGAFGLVGGHGWIYPVTLDHTSPGW